MIDQLPLELLHLIWENLDKTSHMNAFVRTCRRLYVVYNPRLYRHVVKDGSSLVMKWAIKRGTIETVRKLIQAGADPTGTRSYSPIHDAVDNGRLSVVELLLEHDVDPDEPGDYWYTPLVSAITQGYISIVKLLLEHDVAPNGQDSAGQTPLSHAAEKGHVTIVKLLLEHNADPNRRDNHSGMTPLCSAASGSYGPLHDGHLAVVKLLLEHNVDVNARDTRGATPLFNAAQKGHTGIVQLLLAKGADVNLAHRNLGTRLSAAASRGFEDLVTLLLEKGARVFTDTYDGNTLGCAVRGGSLDIFKKVLEAMKKEPEMDINKHTPLSSAVRRGYTHMVRLLLREGADILQKDQFNDTAVDLAFKLDRDNVLAELLANAALMDEPKGYWEDLLVRAAATGCSETVQVLLGRGVPVNCLSASRCAQKSLISAAKAGHEKVVTLLIEAGAHIEARNENNQTSLIIAAYHGHQGIVRLLLNAHANIEAEDDDGNTPLLVAVRQSQAKVVKLLLDAGANPNCRDSCHRTALCYAALLGDADVVLAFLDDGTPPETWKYGQYRGPSPPRYYEFIDTPDAHNWTPLFYATMHGQVDIVQILLCRGTTAVQTPTSAGRTPLTLAGERRHEYSSKGDHTIQAIWEYLSSPSKASVNVERARVERVGRIVSYGENYYFMARGVPRCDACAMPLAAVVKHPSYFREGDGNLCYECSVSGPIHCNDRFSLFIK